MKTMEVPKEFLTAVLNELHRDSKLDMVKVKECFTGNTLFQISLDDWSISDVIDKEDYKIRYHGLVNRLDDCLRSEVPDWSALLGCLWSSLALPPDKTKRKEIGEIVNDTIKRSRRGFNFEGQTAIAIDTNLFYNRFLTRMFMERSRFNIEFDNCKDLMVLVSLNCIRELSGRAHKKLDSSSNPMELQKWMADKDLAAALNNRPKLLARKALNGMAEQARLRNIFSYDSVQKGPTGYGNDEMDLAIVDDISEYRRDKQIQVSFITADKSMSSLLTGQNFRHCVVDYPLIVPPVLKPGPWYLRELLYDLAITYGRIELEGASIIINGVWKTKETEHYIDTETIQVTVDENSLRGKEIVRNYRIMNRFQKSGIIKLDKLS